MAALILRARPSRHEAGVGHVFAVAPGLDVAEAGQFIVHQRNDRFARPYLLRYVIGFAGSDARTAGFGRLGHEVTNALRMDGVPGLGNVNLNLHNKRGNGEGEKRGVSLLPDQL